MTSAELRELAQRLHTLHVITCAADKVDSRTTKTLPGEASAALTACAEREEAATMLSSGPTEEEMEAAKLIDGSLGSLGYLARAVLRWKEGK